MVTTVADYESCKNKCDVLESKVNIHRIKEVLKHVKREFTFPVAELRRERDLIDQNVDAPKAVPDPDENSDTEDRPKGEELTNANADPADELSAKAGVHLGTDERGFG